MWKPWQWARSSNEWAVDNARAASTELGRCRVERAEVDLFLRRHGQRPPASIRTTTRPA